MHPLLENDHQKLMTLIETLDKCVMNGHSVSQVNQYLDAFVSLAKDEFENEENLMKEYHYPDFNEHRKEHERLLEQLLSVHEQLKKGHTPFGEEYMHWLRNWLETHLLDADSLLDEFLYQANSAAHRA